MASVRNNEVCMHRTKINAFLKKQEQIENILINKKVITNK